MTTRQHYPNGIVKTLRFRTTSNLKLDAADLIERLLTENQMLLNELKTRQALKTHQFAGMRVGAVSGFASGVGKGPSALTSYVSSYTQREKQTDTNAPEQSEHRAQETTDAPASVPEHKKQQQFKSEAEVIPGSTK